ncbi:type II toxin-antitoxin system antitoxin DNA ADP-ribosyl glycohydrolase DarG [Marinimicrobium sp. C2-29]|uniref:type II toxin-antitoxin system antitoxin DNA ADP-ribosyl glycohydrolase DarG n=1 Tax=Marinimicrobium sp. C2-29 TaxID=3139825 RepID=UPI00313A4868
MIEYTKGDILQDDAEAIVNTVNCVGVMGRGIALQFKNAFPGNFKAYAEACKHNEVRPGQMFVYEVGQLTSPRFVINFPTKRHWRGASRLEDVDAGLVSLAQTIRRHQIQSIAIPPLGSGLGGLRWDDVKVLIEDKLSSLEDVVVKVYEPKGAPVAEKMVRNKKVPKMTAGRAALVELMDRYFRGLLDPSISLLELHKLMYFMQDAGEPLNLKYQKGLYGPYAENLRHVLKAVEGHLVSGYADGGDQPNKPLQLVPGASKDAAVFLDKHPETHARFEQVSDLVEGFETPYGLELLSTVHWVVKNESVNTFSDVVNRIHAWSERKQQFTTRQIKIAVDILVQKGWLPPLPEASAA